MAVFPRVAGIFAGAFTIITDAYKSKAAEKGIEIIIVNPDNNVIQEHFNPSEDSPIK
jgi:aspartate/glutamate racemase